MTNLRKAAEMALDALTVSHPMANTYNSLDKHSEAMSALRTALAQPANQSDCGHKEYRLFCQMCMATKQKPEQEPVAWYYADSDVEIHSVALSEDLDDDQKANCIPLYTAPPSKQEPVAWVKEGKVRVGFGRIEERKYVQFDQTLPIGTKLFAAPVSKQEWVSLTDEKIEHEWVKWKASVPRYYGFAKGIEAALKEKNA